MIKGPEPIDSGFIAQKIDLCFYAIIYRIIIDISVII